MTLGWSFRLSGPSVTCLLGPELLASPCANVTSVLLHLPVSPGDCGGTCPLSPRQGSTRTQAAHARASLLSPVPLCLLGPSSAHLPSQGRLRIQLRGPRGVWLSWDGALRTPFVLRAPSHVSPRAGSPSRPSTTSPSLRSTRRSWWTSRRSVAGGARPVAREGCLGQSSETRRGARGTGRAWVKGSGESRAILRPKVMKAALAPRPPPTARVSPGHRPL